MKYVHDFVVRFLVVIQRSSNGYVWSVSHIIQACFTGIGIILILGLFQWQYLKKPRKKYINLRQTAKRVQMYWGVLLRYMQEAH